MTDEAEVERLRAARDRVIERIAVACNRSGRDPSEVTLVAVSKTVPAERLVAAIAAGLTTLGENRVQEAAAKIPQIAGARWHLVGPLQSNKARRAIELFDVIETVDAADIVHRIDRMAGEIRPNARLPVLVQVNVDRDPAKSGVDPDALVPLLAEVGRLPHVEIAGLMTIGREAVSPEQARKTFRSLRSMSERARGAGLALGPGLSMGMTDDFEIAVEEGATIVRVGRAIFGERPHVDEHHH